MQKRFTEAQIVGFLREADAGVAVKDLCPKHGFSDGSYYCWRSPTADHQRSGKADQNGATSMGIRLHLSGRRFLRYLVSRG
jgi:hypothetical protein